jgi:hypothetical protein
MANEEEVPRGKAIHLREADSNDRARPKAKDIEFARKVARRIGGLLVQMLEADDG